MIADHGSTFKRRARMPERAVARDSARCKRRVCEGLFGLFLNLLAEFLHIFAETFLGLASDGERQADGRDYNHERTESLGNRVHGRA